MDISLIKARLAAAADTVAGLTCFGYVPDSVPEPCFYAGEVAVIPHNTFGAMDDIEITCKVLVSRSDDLAGQKLLDGLLKRTGATSVRAALLADRTLGGACDSLAVQRVQGYRLYAVGDKQYYGAEIVVRVIGDDD